jgi:sulfite reductase alpha subunit-like flavoprotein
MRLPEANSMPLILVGPGTGIAPFRAFIQQRRLSQASGDILVFFGCRSRQADFFYEEEWQQAQESGELELVVAASRDQQEKVYVQHKIVEYAKRVWELLQKGAVVYICGCVQRVLPVCFSLKREQIIYSNAQRRSKSAQDRLSARRRHVRGRSREALVGTREF